MQVSELDTQKRYTTITTISLTPEEMRTIDEVGKLENLPRRSRSASIAFLIHFYSSKRLGEFEPLPPEEALKEAARLEKAANWYRMQAASDAEAAKREAEKLLATTQ
jgi:hypothetical protein